MEGHGTTDQRQRYTYNLTDLSAGQYTFRLRQVDLDGGTSLSSEVAVQIQPQNGLELSRPSPNPFNDQTQFTVSVSERQDVQVDVFNTLGQHVATLHDGSLGAGEVQSFALEGNALPSGVYFVRGQTATRTVTHRIVLLR